MYDYNENKQPAGRDYVNFDVDTIWFSMIGYIHQGDPDFPNQVHIEKGNGECGRPAIPKLALNCVEWCGIYPRVSKLLVIEKFRVRELLIVVGETPDFPKRGFTFLEPRSQGPNKRERDALELKDTVTERTRPMYHQTRNGRGWFIDERYAVIKKDPRSWKKLAADMVKSMEEYQAMEESVGKDLMTGIFNCNFFST